MREKTELTTSSVIADIGSGTGLLSKLFLDYRNRVYGVEPNQAMREAGDEFLRGYPNFTSIDGTAEQTKLNDSSVDFVTAGQAFHWFDAVAFRCECQRILKPDGWAVLVWNESREDSTPFMRDFEVLMRRFGRDYRNFRREAEVEDDVTTFFGIQGCQTLQLENNMTYGFDKLLTRLASGSYMPDPGEPEFSAMRALYSEIFNKHSVEGIVEFEQDTRVYYGQLDPA